MRKDAFRKLRGRLLQKRLFIAGRLHPKVQLIDAGDKYEQREHNGEYDVVLVAAEDVDKLHVGRLGHQHVDDVGRGVVHPVHRHSGQYAARAVIHPAEKQPYEQGVGHLHGVGVDEGEDHGGYGYGHPMAAERAEQRAEYGSAEHQFLDERRQEAQREVAVVVAEYHLERLAFHVRHIRKQPLEPRRGYQRAQGGHGAPEEHAPLARAQVGWRHYGELPPHEQGYHRGARHGRCRYEHGRGYGVGVASAERAHHVVGAAARGQHPCGIHYP